MMNRLRILHLEDNPHDRELVQSLLESDGIACDIDHVESRENFRGALEEDRWDLIISDFTLPGYDGLSALTLAQQRRPEVPYLFVSGTMGEEQAVESLKHGATDYVLKHRLDRLIPAVRRALRESEDRRQRRQSELLRGAFLELGQKLNSATTPQDAARIILDVAQQLLGWDAGSLDLYVIEHKATRPVLMMEMVLGQRIDVPRVAAHRLLTPQIRKCLEQGGRLILPNGVEATADEALSSDTAQLAPSSLFVPVRHGNKVIGFLGIEKYTSPTYCGQDLKTLQALADHCGGALERIAIAEEKDRLISEIQKQQQRLDNILAGVPAIVWESWRVPSPINQQINFVSRYVEPMMGYSAQEWLATPDVWLRLVHPEDKQRVYQEFDRMFATGKGLTHQCRWISKDNKILWVETSATVIAGENGTPAGLRGVTIDITEKKKIEAQLLRSQRIESIGRLTSGIAHDLNNVLAPILMSAQVLKEKTEDAESKELLSLVETHARRAGDIVKQLVAFARGTECDRALMESKPFLDEMLKTVHGTFPKSISVLSEIPEDLWTLSGNPTQLHQVILNLCVNARDAMLDGGTLTITAKNIILDETTENLSPDTKLGPHIVVQVKDTGVGISADIMDKIFDPFFTTKEHHQGTGLGLSTVLGIVKGHGGFLTVESEPGHGSQFNVYLPAVPAAEAPSAPIQETRPPSGNGESVLVVDDEPGIRELARQVLENAGYRVMLAANGAEALTLLNQSCHQIQLVLTDLMMPVMDGIALIRGMKKMRSGARVIASSGYGFDEKLVELRALEVGTLLDKPYCAERLLNVVYRELHAVG